MTADASSRVGANRSSAGNTHRLIQKARNGHFPHERHQSTMTRSHLMPLDSVLALYLDLPLRRGTQIQVLLQHPALELPSLSDHILLQVLMSHAERGRR